MATIGGFFKLLYCLMWIFVAVHFTVLVLSGTKHLFWGRSSNICISAPQAQGGDAFDSEGGIKEIRQHLELYKDLGIGCPPCSTELLQDFILYNVASGTGDEYAQFQMSTLAASNNFTFEVGKNMGKMSQDEESKFVKNITKWRAAVLYTAEFPFVNFTGRWERKPFYINLIRDPAARRAVIYNDNLKKKKLNMTFEECVKKKKSECTTKIVSQFAMFTDSGHYCDKMSAECLSRAKTIMLSSYELVGLAEDLRAYFYLLEKYYPRFFKGLWKKHLLNEAQMRRTSAGTISQEAEAISSGTKTLMTKVFAEEYEFYHLVNQLFYHKLLQYPYTYETSRAEKEMKIKW